MKIAVVNETSSADKNPEIVNALENRGHEIINCGMRKGKEPPELSYIHTGIISALVLATGAADFVVGGCGTGQGFLNSVLLYPGVACGHLLTPLDAWLFARINGGNCVSLALNQGYGWAGEINLRLIFDQLFTPEQSMGYPESRREPQAVSRALLARISGIAHKTMGDIVTSLPDEAVVPALRSPGIMELLLLASGNEKHPDPELARAIEARYRG
jgi:ribose 5-phosphate isomerase RpiB